MSITQIIIAGFIGATGAYRFFQDANEFSSPIFYHLIIRYPEISQATPGLGWDVKQTPRLPFACVHDFFQRMHA
jgi:hypothetical protein